MMFPYYLKFETTPDLIQKVTLSPKEENFFVGNPSAALVKQTIEFLESYPHAPLPPLDWRVLTPFREKVLRILLQIPCGSTLSYKEVAALLGKPKAARAIGGACRENPFPFLVPCHRVVGSNGLGGFLFGLGIKKTLLNFEENLRKSP